MGYGEFKEVLLAAYHATLRRGAERYRGAEQDPAEVDGSSRRRGAGTGGGRAGHRQGPGGGGHRALTLRATGPLGPGPAPVPTRPIPASTQSQPHAGALPGVTRGLPRPAAQLRGAAGPPAPPDPRAPDRRLRHPHRPDRREVQPVAGADCRPGPRRRRRVPGDGGDPRLTSRAGCCCPVEPAADGLEAGEEQGDPRAELVRRLLRVPEVPRRQRASSPRRDLLDARCSPGGSPRPRPGNGSRRRWRRSRSAG